MKKSPADYLTIGPLTKDLVGNGYTLGGTVAYASKTALSFGLRPAIVTSHSPKLNIDNLKGVEIINKPSAYDTTFENIQTPEGRVQLLHETAEKITRTDIPDDFRQTPIVHVGPLTNEVEEDVISFFSDDCLLGITPQGWLRKRSEDGHVVYRPWQPSEEICRRANAVVISDEDVCKDESVIQNYAQMFKLLVVTEGFNGARVYWHGDVRLFRAPKIDAVDATGAGDIFAATFFIRLKATNDPWISTETAVQLASLSITRQGLNGVPTPKEVQSRLIEIIKGSSSQ